MIDMRQGRVDRRGFNQQFMLIEMTTIYSHSMKWKEEGERKGVGRGTRGREGKESGGRRKEKDERRDCQSTSGIRQQAGGEKSRGIVGQDVQQQRHPRGSRERKEPDAGY